jgi:hypothetical protein
MGNDMTLEQALAEHLSVTFFSITTQEPLRLQHIALAQANGCTVHEFTETFACECALNVLAIGPRKNEGRIANAMKELKGLKGLKG